MPSNPIKVELKTHGYLVGGIPTPLKVVNILLIYG